jgi:mono/diheme cytochrome c family protein
MAATTAGLVVGSLTAILGAPTALGPAPKSTASSPQSSTGPFTPAQAERGQVVFAESCASCHGTDLNGRSAPPLTGPAFEQSWSHPRVTLDDLFFVQRTTMPPRAPTTITPADHAAVFAYLLQVNDYQPGAVAVSPGAPGLREPPRWVNGRAGTGAGTAGSGPAAPEFIAGAPGVAPASTGPDQAALSSAAGSTDWLHYTHDYSGTRFSPLDQITTANASALVPACMFQVGEPDNFQTGPLVHAGTMYVPTWKTTIALDAVTCRPMWRHTWEPRG